MQSYGNWYEDDWLSLLPHCQVAMNNRPAASTGVSPFFLCHGYYMELVQLPSSATPRNTTSPIAAGERIAKKFADIHDLAKASPAAAKEEQEHQAMPNEDVP